MVCRIAWPLWQPRGAGMRLGSQPVLGWTPKSSDVAQGHQCLGQTKLPNLLRNASKKEIEMDSEGKQRGTKKDDYTCSVQGSFSCLFSSTAFAALAAIFYLFNNSILGNLMLPHLLAPIAYSYRENRKISKKNVRQHDAIKVCLAMAMASSAPALASSGPKHIES